MALTIKQISDALGISRSRVEQWISRRYFRTPDTPPGLGKARDWDVSDALRLAIMDLLLQHNLSAEDAGRLVYLAPQRFEDDTSFFVAWSGWHEMAGGGKARLPDTLYEHSVRGSELGEFLTNPDVEYSIVINLDTLAASVEESLSRLENFKAAVQKAGAKYDE